MRNATLGIALLLLLGSGIAGAGSFRCDAATANTMASASVCLVNEENTATQHSWEEKASIASAHVHIKTGAFDSESAATIGEDRTWATDDENGAHSGRDSGSHFTTSGRSGFRVLHDAEGSIGQQERAGETASTGSNVNATVVDALLRVTSIDVSAGQARDATTCRDSASAEFKVLSDGTRLFPGAACQSAIPYLDQSGTAVLSDLLLP